MLKNAGNKHLAREFSSSVVSIFVTTFYPDPKYPWNPPTTKLHRGSGSVINQEKGWILTCAHVANTQTEIEVCLGNDAERYSAKLLVQDNDCDMSIIEVDHPTFRAKAKQVLFGKMHALGDPVIVVGFPFTGNELAATPGYTTNNEVSEYLQGDGSNLHTIVSASINPGNSGGPVFNSPDGHQIGVAFQGLDPDQYESANEMIPMPVIEQFLKGAYRAIQNNTAHTGVPALPIDCAEMKNSALRQKYHMKEEHTGVRVFCIDNLAMVGDLKVNDIILEIDGNPIQNDGTIDTRPDICSRLHFSFLIHQKQIGDDVRMKVLRDGKETEITVPLHYRARELKLIERKNYCRQETYYIRNGIAFTPVRQADVLPDDDKPEQNVYHLEYEDIVDIPKMKTGQELVSIHHFFHATVTHGYDELNSEDIGTVHKINGKEINNFKELIMVMESLASEYLVIEIKNQETIALRVTSPEEEAEILNIHHISKGHSEDLESFIQTLRNKPPAFSSSSASKPSRIERTKSTTDANSDSHIPNTLYTKGIKHV